MDPIKEQLDELTAIIETLRAAVGALASTHPNQALLLQEYDGFTASLQALVQGQAKSDWYIETLAKHVGFTRTFLAVEQPPGPATS